MTLDDFHKKYKRLLSGACLADLMSKHPRKLMQMVKDFRELMDSEFRMEDKDITYRSLNIMPPAFDVGINLLFQKNCFSDLNTGQIDIYHFLYGDWLMTHINDLIDRNFASLNIDHNLATIVDVKSDIGIDILENFKTDISDEDFMASDFSKLDRETFNCTNTPGYIFIHRVPRWIHSGSDSEDREDDGPDYYFGCDYFDFVKSNEDFPSRSVILDIVERWAYKVNTAPGIEILTDMNISEELRNWVLSQNNCDFYKNRHGVIYSLREMKGASPGPLPEFDYEKTFTYGGESVTMNYRVFISKNENLDLLAIKSRKVDI